MAIPPGALQMRNMIGTCCHCPAVVEVEMVESWALGEVAASKTSGPGAGVARGQVLDRTPANLALVNLDPETLASLKPATDLRNENRQSLRERWKGEETYTP